MTEKKFYPLKVVKVLGTPISATTLDGITVYRKDRIFIPELGTSVLCAQYDEHFVYEEPTGKKGRPSFMCTCGSAAIVAGVSGYEGQQSPSGLMLLCMLHATRGHHSNTSPRRWA